MSRRPALRRILSLALLLAPLLAFSAPTVTRLSFDPPLYGVGEAVRIAALLDGLPPDLGTDISAKPGQGLPPQGESADPELREIQLVRTAEGWELRATIIPWSPGHGVLAGLELRGLKFPALAYSAASSLGPEDRDISPPRPQRDPPGAALYFYTLAGIALAVVVASASSAAWLLPAARALIARRQAAQAFRRLSRSLDFLAEQAPSSRPPAYYAALSRALRLYLSERALGAASALTASELAVVPDSALPAPGVKDRIAGLLRAADSARYGESPRAPEAMRKDAEEARDIGIAIEEVLLARL